MGNLYKGKQRCAGCGRTGEEHPRFEKDGLCHDCAEKLQLGREVAAQLATEYSAVRFPELSTVHMTWYEIPYIQDAFKKFINRMTEFSTKFASKYGKTPFDDFVLGRADCGTSSDVFVVPTEAVEPLKELCHALQDKMWEVKLKEDNMRRDLMKELDMEREEIYNDGVDRGRDLLRQLNEGEIGLNDFKARQKYEKPKNKTVQMERLDFLNEQLGTSYASLDNVDWDCISGSHELSEDFIREFKDMVVWDYISSCQKLSEDFIREFSDRVIWIQISKCQKLSEDFIREFSDKVDWARISKCQKLSEDFIREFSDKVDWTRISIYQKLSDEFIREFKGDVSWDWISRSQKLSEDFIREFKDRVYWYYVSAAQKLSEGFIREFSDRVDWTYISIYQKLSENFIREFKGDVSWDWISLHQKLSDNFIREFKVNLDMDSIRDNWAYKDAEFLKAQVEKTGLYECHDDYFIAYKGIRLDRYSKYNFQYRYLPGETYESFCDCSPNENSFGLSVWTEGKAKEYSDELVVKVKVKYEDVGRVVHDGGKIRCRKITILD